MNACVEFTIYGPTLAAIEAQTIVILQGLGGSDQLWDIRYNVSIGVAHMDGTINQWKCEVTAYTKPDESWRNGS